MDNRVFSNEEEEEAESSYEKSESEENISLPPKDLILPKFIKNDSGLFFPPMLASDFSDFDEETSSAEENNLQNSIKFPTFQFPSEVERESNNSPENEKSIRRDSIFLYKKLGKPEFKNQKKVSYFQYFNEQYATFLKLPPKASKEEILEKARQYSVLYFAKNHFRKHHFPNSNMKYYSIDELTTYSEKPLYKMLLKEVPDEKKELGKAISQLIIRYIRAEDENIDNIPVALVSTLRENTDAIDEIFFQLIKYSTNCPDKNKLSQVWKLWLILGSMFPISESVQPTIFSFLIRIIFKCSDPRGDFPSSQSANVHLSKSLPSVDQLSNESDAKENDFYQTDIVFNNFARFVFIRMHERSCQICSIYMKDVTKENLMNMPKVVRYGRSMFYCSLYEVMYCQRRFYPLLPIPAPLYLILKQIKENGGFLSPEFLIVKTHPESRNIMAMWVDKLPHDASVIKSGEVNELVGLLFHFLYNLTDSIIPKFLAEVFIEKCQEKKYDEIFEKMPLLHLNSLRYLIGFLQEALSFEKYNLMSKEKIAENIKTFLVETNKKIIEPFKRFKMLDLCQDFIIYCLEKLDCSSVYPMNPEFAKRTIFKKPAEKAKTENQEKKQQPKNNKEEEDVNDNKSKESNIKNTKEQNNSFDHSCQNADKHKKKTRHKSFSNQ